MIPRDQTLLIIEDELRGAAAWAERASVPLQWLPEPLEIQAVFTQPETNEKFYLQGLFDNYRELPPEWQFCDASWVAGAAQQNYPKPDSSPIGSVFHSNAVICAPFNRLAYSVHGGPHSDWAMPQWHSLPQAQVKASTLGDMLMIFLRDIKSSRGRMG